MCNPDISGLMYKVALVSLPYSVPSLEVQLASWTESPVRSIYDVRNR